MENNSQQPLIFKAIPAVMAELGAVGKNSRNQQQGYRFRSIDDVTNALKPLLSKHNVFVVPTLMSSEREERQTAKGGTIFYERCKYAFDFYAGDGSSVQAVVQSEGMDSADKASNKALVAAFKYLVTTVFCIATEDTEDADKSTEEVRPATYPQAVPEQDEVLTSDGVPYDELPTDQLVVRVNSMMKKLKNNGLSEDEKSEYERKVKEAQRILAERNRK